MDLIDKKILCEIDLNCRTPISQLAKKLRINRNVASYRIKNLEDAGIIMKYVCFINLGLLGFKTYKIYFKIRGGQASETSFVNDLINDKRVIHLLKNEGAYDYSATIAVKQLFELDSFLTDLMGKFKDLIKDYYLSILVSSQIYKLNKFLLNEDAQLTEEYSVDEEKINIDEIDKKIIRALSQNANLPIIELAKITGLSVDIVNYRLKSLSKGLITSFKIIYDLSKLGYYHYIIMLRAKNATKNDIAHLNAWCAKKYNIFYCTKRIGLFNFEINAAINDINNLNIFLDELKKEFSNIIESYELVIDSKLLKLNYVPF